MDNLNFSRLRAEEQNVFIGSGKWVGIQDISINSNFGAETLRYLGIGNKQEYLMPTSEQSADVTINSLILNSDPYDSLVNGPINIFILPNEKSWTTNYSLIGGYLTFYSLQCSIGTVPQSNASLKFYTKAGQLSTGDLSIIPRTQLINITNTDYTLSNTGIPYIPHHDSITLTLDEYNTNRVQNFSIDLNFNQVPIYNVGNPAPIRVDSLSPISVDCNFTFECNTNQSGIPFRTFPSIKKEQNIVLTLTDYTTSSAITSYTLPNMTLINESVNSSLDSNVSITRNYKGYIAI